MMPEEKTIPSPKAVEVFVADVFDSLGVVWASDAGQDLLNDICRDMRVQQFRLTAQVRDVCAKAVCYGCQGKMKGFNQIPFKLNTGLFVHQPKKGTDKAISCTASLIHALKDAELVGGK